MAAPLGLCTQSNSSARPDAAHPDTWRRVTPLPLPRSNCMDVTLAVGGGKLLGSQILQDELAGGSMLQKFNVTVAS